jgi:predicted DNA-binding transcriptional regulator AlpA
VGAKGRLYTTGDIAGRLGVSRQRAWIVAQRNGFPESFDDLQNGSVWLVEDVEAWIRAHRSHLTGDQPSTRS